MDTDKSRHEFEATNSLIEIVNVINVYTKCRYNVMLWTNRDDIAITLKILHN